ncbi:MAG: hypothetical protein KAT09_09405, partial [Candidatus Aegiribacteria sp.]|nr:hypothetical protein [Candidatus Aegiribacteria sp.]
SQYRSCDSPANADLFSYYSRKFILCHNSPELPAIPLSERRSASKNKIVRIVLHLSLHLNRR